MKRTKPFEEAWTDMWKSAWTKAWAETIWDGLFDVNKPVTIKLNTHLRWDKKLEEARSAKLKEEQKIDGWQLSGSGRANFTYPNKGLAEAEGISMKYKDQKVRPFVFVEEPPEPEDPLFNLWSKFWTECSSMDSFNLNQKSFDKVKELGLFTLCAEEILSLLYAHNTPLHVLKSAIAIKEKYGS